MLLTPWLVNTAKQSVAISVLMLPLFALRLRMRSSLAILASWSELLTVAPRGTLHCAQARYYKRASDTNTCRSGYKHIVYQTTCENAASVLGERCLSSEPESSYPKGCFSMDGFIAMCIRLVKPSLRDSLSVGLRRRQRQAQQCPPQLSQ